MAEAVSKALSAQKKEQEEKANNIDALLNLNLEESCSESEWQLMDHPLALKDTFLHNEIHVLRSTLINNKKPEKAKEKLPLVPVAFGVIKNEI